MVVAVGFAALRCRSTVLYARPMLYAFGPFSHVCLRPASPHPPPPSDRDARLAAGSIRVDLAVIGIPMSGHRASPCV